MHTPFLWVGTEGYFLRTIFWNNRLRIIQKQHLHRYKKGSNTFFLPSNKYRKHLQMAPSLQRVSALFLTWQFTWLENSLMLIWYLWCSYKLRFGERHSVPNTHIFYCSFRIATFTFSFFKAPGWSTWCRRLAYRSYFMIRSLLKRFWFAPPKIDVFRALT